MLVVLKQNRLSKARQNDRSIALSLARFGTPFDYINISSSKYGIPGRYTKYLVGIVLGDPRNYGVLLAIDISR